MKKTVIIVLGLLMCAAAVTVIGQKKVLSPKQERREVREKRRAERIANYEQFMDSLVQSRNFQFNPQSMQRQPAGPLRQIMNPEFSLGIWDGTADICLPYIKGYVAPYYVTIINYTVSDLQGYTCLLYTSLLCGKTLFLHGPAVSSFRKGVSGRSTESVWNSESPFFRPTRSGRSPPGTSRAPETS